MENSSGPGPEHTAFTQWVVSHGVEIKGVAPARFPGRRLGMVATRVIEENEIMLSIPVNLMLTVDSIPKEFVSLFPEGTPVQGILAAFLTHGNKEDQSQILKEMSLWRSVWPAWEEFEQSMPIFWTGRLRVSNLRGFQSHSQDGDPDSNVAGTATRSLLPLSITGHQNGSPNQHQQSNFKFNSNPSYETRYQNLLPQQETRFRKAWDSVVSVFPETETNRKTFAYNWAIINSRSFYYVSPGEDEPEDWNDAIAMVPFADYFNHDDDAACEVVFDGKWYTFKATRRYEKGEEVYMNYGEHSNDFLWVEYGFFLDNNPSDGIYLDDIILPTLSRSEKKELVEYNCLGNYEITASGANASTFAAASIKYMSRQNWRDYLGGDAEEGFDEEKSASVIRDWIEEYLRECSVTFDALTKASKNTNDDSEKEKLGLMLARWKQIQQLCESAIENITA
ncbi:uncharacterized protein BDV17DRAFT_301531 [Aspergillus undulatus]|uniref:uncharacterized protein n=1 Tax=Aspergillus undulatus TaxID=1810928 RepID=UPI003CCCFA10